VLPSNEFGFHLREQVAYPGPRGASRAAGTHYADRSGRCKPWLYSVRSRIDASMRRDHTPSQPDGPETRPAYFSASRRRQTEPACPPGTCRRSPHRRPRLRRSNSRGSRSEPQFPGGGVRCGRTKSESASADVRCITNLRFCCAGMMPTHSASCKASAVDPPAIPRQQQTLVIRLRYSANISRSPPSAFAKVTGVMRPRRLTRRRRSTVRS